MRRLTCMCLAILLCACLWTSAMAEVQLLPEIAGWDWLTQPLQLSVTVDVKAHQPFDENRTAQLNAIIKHMSMALHTQTLGEERWSRVQLLLDGESVASVMQRETPQQTEAQFSSLPDTTLTWPKDSGMSLTGLLGAAGTDGTVFGLDGSENAWLKDAQQMFEALCEAMPERIKAEKSGAAIKNMGKAAEKQVLTTPKDAAEGLHEILVQLCPEGKFRNLLSTLTFSGKQVMTLWRAADGSILRADWSGKAGTSADDMRNVSLTWRMLRTEETVRDDLTLKTPKVKGNGRNNIVFSRTMEIGDGETMLDMEFRYETVAAGEKTVVTGDASLKRTDAVGGPNLTGEVELARQTPDADDHDRYVIAPVLTFTGSADAPTAEGTISVKRYRDKSLMEDADVSIQLNTAPWLEWELRSGVTAVQDANAAALREKIIDRVTVDLVRRLVLLPAEDTLFLSADIDPALWQQIVEAAQTALQ